MSPLTPEALNLIQEGDPVAVNVLYGQVRQSGHWVAMVELKSGETSCWGTSVQARRWFEWLVMAGQAAFADATILNWRFGKRGNKKDQQVTAALQSDWLAHTARLLPRNPEVELKPGQLKGDFDVVSLATPIPAVGLRLSGVEINVVAPLAFRLAGKIMQKAAAAELSGALNRAMRLKLKANNAAITGFTQVVYQELEGVVAETEAFEAWLVERMAKQDAAGGRGDDPAKIIQDLMQE